MPSENGHVCAFTAIVDSIFTPPSPSPDLLRTNTTPTHQEDVHIRTTLRQVDRDISSLDDALDHLKVIQERLSHKREELRAFATQHRSIISPVRCIPPELLAEIFLHMGRIFSDRPYPYSYNMHVEHIRDVILPSHICQRWRHIALSTPELWAYINVEIGSARSKPGNMSHRLACAQSWISRTAGYPLSIQLSWLSDGRKEDWDSLLDIVIPHTTRWRSFKLHISQNHHDHHLAVIKHNLPMLNDLFLWIAPRSVLDGRTAAFDLFEIAPQLRRVAIAIGRMAIHKLRLPWAQLTHCEPGRLPVAACLDVMQQCPSLVSFHAGLSSSMSTIANPIIRLAHLSTLVLEVECDSTSFFLSLSLPSLTDLQYYVDNEDTDEGPVPFASVIKSYPIKRLTATISQPMENDGLSRLLKDAPNLKRLALLDLTSPRVTSRSLQSLLVHSGNACLVPRLESLALEYYGNCHDDDESEHFDLQLFLEMAESRQRISGEAGAPTRRLRSIELNDVQIDSFNKFDSTLLERLLVLIDEGLELKKVFAFREPSTQSSSSSSTGTSDSQT